jgi:N-acyl-D-aspartate/D-glutamate deacylase
MTIPKINWHAVGGICFLACFWAVVLVLVISLIVGCAPTKIIDRTEYRTIGLDSASGVQMREARTKSVEQRMDSAMRAVTTQVTTQQESQQVERERITETITSWVDSLGRELRQEQRVTDRNTSKQQKLTEERLVEEFETRLQQAITRHDSEWNAKLEQLRTHFERTDSVADKKLQGKAAETWIDKFDRKFGWLLILALALVFIFTRKFWLPMVRH